MKRNAPLAFAAAFLLASTLAGIAARAFDFSGPAYSEARRTLDLWSFVLGACAPLVLVTFGGLIRKRSKAGRSSRPTADDGSSPGTGKP